MFVFVVRVMFMVDILMALLCILFTGEGDQTTAVSGRCIHSFGFILTVTVLALLLFVAMVTIIILVTIRRGELVTKGA